MRFATPQVYRTVALIPREEMDEIFNEKGKIEVSEVLSWPFFRLECTSHACAIPCVQSSSISSSQPLQYLPPYPRRPPQVKCEFCKRTYRLSGKELEEAYKQVGPA